MVTKERFAQGMTVQQYLDQMVTNRDTFMKFLGEIKVSTEDRKALESLGKKLKCMVITEDWCGDALYNVPVLLKLVEGNPNIETRIFLRDKNPDLMDQYLNKSMFRSIPVFAFFDENMPLLRYWSIRSGFLSRRKMRVSMFGLPSTSLRSTGTL